LIRILIYTFFFRLVLRKHLEAAFFLKGSEGFRFDTDKIPFYTRRFYFEPFDVSVVVDGVNEGFMIDPEKRFNKSCFKFGKNPLIEERYLEEKIFIEGLAVHTQFFRSKPHSSKPPALPVPAVVHLNGRFKYMFSADRDIARKTRNAATALFRFYVFPSDPLCCFPKGTTAFNDFIREYSFAHTETSPLTKHLSLTVINLQPLRERQE
jgi:hypothetical protein